MVRFEEEARELEEQGIATFNLYAQAGEGFAAMAARRLLDDPASAIDAGHADNASS